MNEESIRNRIRILLDEIHGDADPVLLNRCRSIFRQEVSFFRRSYMAAYLLLLAEGPVEKKPAGSVSRSGGRGRKDREPPRGKRAQTPSAGYQTENSRGETLRVLSEEESVQLFVGIGRNRKVFPREILALITARAKVARDDIGMIRVLDNYSFVQVRTPAADTVIQALNGSSFRGRGLTVNHARRGKEDEQNETAAQPDG